MKKSILFLFLFLIFCGCSDDDNENGKSADFPTISNFSTSEASVGGVLTIYGDFDINESYSIEFNENIIATIFELDSKYIKIIVPDGAITGNITLTHNGETKVIGSISISDKSTFYAIRHHGEGSTQITTLVKIDTITGQREKIIDLTTDYLESLTVDKKDNKIFAIANDDGSEINKLYKIDVKNKTYSTVTLGDKSGIYYQLAYLDSKGLYAVKEYDEGSSQNTTVVRIDTTSGNEEILIDFKSTDYLESPTVDEKDNKIFAIANDDGSETNKLYTIDVTNKTYSTVSIGNKSGIYYQLAYFNSKGLYAVKEYDEGSSQSTTVVKIDTTSGNEETLIDLKSTDYLESLTVDEGHNRIYAIANIGDGNESSKLYAIDVASEKFSTIDLGKEYGIYYEIALMN